MGGLARIALEQGHRVGGADINMYPPMSNQLEQLGVDLHQGYEPSRVKEWQPELVIVGNALSRGNPVVEAILEDGTRYISGPQWMYEQVLRHRWVLAVAGTHGKTTTASLLSWLLEYAGYNPGFLIGGVPENFGVSARLGSEPYFVIEADEYDTAFFDKRSKFVHYHPRTLVLNNLEYDHADIFDSIEEIKKQFHHLVRTVPGQGLILVNADDTNLPDVLAQGCWSKQQDFSVQAKAHWSAQRISKDFSRFDIEELGGTRCTIQSPLVGSFNVCNAVAAIAAAAHAGVSIEKACAAVADFKSVKRRLQLLTTIRGVHIYDDFAHHPTAIHQTLVALRQLCGSKRIICVLEPRSNTMLMGKHQDTLRQCVREADQAFLYKPDGMAWDIDALADETLTVSDSVSEIVRMLVASTKMEDHVVIMSNGSFDNIHRKLINALSVTR